MRNTLAAACAALVLTLGACDRGPRLETRTFTLEHLASRDAAALIDPYVYGDREGAPGTLSTARDAITVRETADNLDRIARVLLEFDAPRKDVRLRFQLIEADGYDERDPRIAAVEEQLRGLLQFDGYRLSGEAVVSATDGTEFQQTLAGNGGLYQVEGRVFWAQGATLRLQDVGLFAPGMGRVLMTTVNVHPGQTLVLGTSSQAGSGPTLLLTVTAEEV